MLYERVHENTYLEKVGIEPRTRPPRHDVLPTNAYSYSIVTLKPAEVLSMFKGILNR